MKTTTLIFLLFLSSHLFSQGWEEYISINALPVSKDLSIGSSLYSHFKKYRFITVGEMHGTLEPAKITEQLARLILLHENNISIGLEIPEKEMTAFLKKPSEKTLKKSIFFSKPNEDGRNSVAWFDLIRYCMSEPRIHLFFYDNSTPSDVSRDSIMYLEIKKEALTHPKNKILTLSGNIHNQLIPFNDHPTMASYLSEDPDFFKENICSIYHYYAEGTMMNNTGNGLELTTIEFQESDFTSSPSENYFIFYESADPTPNNCIFFTRTVHHSESLEPKK